MPLGPRSCGSANGMETTTLIVAGRNGLTLAAHGRGNIVSPLTPCRRTDCLRRFRPRTAGFWGKTARFTGATSGRLIAASGGLDSRSSDRVPARRADYAPVDVSKLPDRSAETLRALGVTPWGPFSCARLRVQSSRLAAHANVFTWAHVSGLRGPFRRAGGRLDGTISGVSHGQHKSGPNGSSHPSAGPLAQRRIGAMHHEHGV